LVLGKRGKMRSTHAALHPGDSPWVKKSKRTARLQILNGIKKKGKRANRE